MLLIDFLRLSPRILLSVEWSSTIFHYSRLETQLEGRWVGGDREWTSNLFLLFWSICQEYCCYRACFHFRREIGGEICHRVWLRIVFGMEHLRRDCWEDWNWRWKNFRWALSWRKCCLCWKGDFHLWLWGSLLVVYDLYLSISWRIN